jgi:hypothetical protein
MWFARSAERALRARAGSEDGSEPKRQPLRGARPRSFRFRRERVGIHVPIGRTLDATQPNALLALVDDDGHPSRVWHRSGSPGPGGSSVRLVTGSVTGPSADIGRSTDFAKARPFISATT